MSLLFQLALEGPLKSGLDGMGIVPIHKFYMTGKFDAQITHLNGPMTVRRLTNTSAVDGNVNVVMADGTTAVFPIPAGGELLGLFNQVLTASTTIAASSLQADV